MATLTAPTSNADLLDNPPRGLVFGVFGVAILVQYVYVLSFNWFPELRLPLSSALAAVHVALAGVTILLRPAAWNLLLVLSAGLMIATLIPSHAMGFGEVRGLDYDQVARKLVLPLMFIWMLAYPLALPRRLLVACATVATLVGAVIAFSGEPVIVSGTPRLASVTGTLEQMHPSAKFITMQLILFDLFRRAGFVRPWFSWVMIALCGAVLLGYGARSQQLFVAVYYLMLMYWRFRREAIVQVTPLIAVVLALFAGYALLYMIPDVVNQWGSGRIGHWQHRVELLAQRDLITFLFGGGIGSDILWSPQWDYSWDGFSAHNDYIYFFTEHGATGLAIMFLMLFALWRRSGDAGRALVIAILISSFFDNGYLRNLLNAVFLALAFSVALLPTLRQQITFRQVAQ